MSDQEDYAVAAEGLADAHQSANDPAALTTRTCANCGCGTEPQHADYPHEPGRLYDCPACEASCHCTPGYTQCVYEGEHNGTADDGTERHETAEPSPCWNDFCVASAHPDDDRHVDTTGYGWTQPRGTVYCPACQGYHPAGDCPQGYDNPVTTIYERGPEGDAQLSEALRAPARICMPSPDKLNDVMEFDHVVQVGEGGAVTDAEGVYAPELHMETDDDGQILDAHERDYIEQARRQGWQLLTGWTGQYGYRGPVMHSSEFVGGALAEHILETPGTYVVTAVETDDEPAGWVVAYREPSDSG
jgi:hypothetical protein